MGIHTLTAVGQMAGLCTPSEGEDSEVAGSGGPLRHLLSASHLPLPDSVASVTKDSSASL